MDAKSLHEVSQFTQEGGTSDTATSRLYAGPAPFVFSGVDLPPAAPLGLITKSSSALGLERVPREIRARRFLFQSASRELLPSERIRVCLRRRLPDRELVDVLHSPANRAAAYGGLMTCGSVWVCPVCAAKISERRRLELSRAVWAWRRGGGQVVLTTYTIRHRDRDSLQRLVDGITLARKRLVSGRWAQDFNRRYGIAGFVRAHEVTWGAVNGWHPHIHELVFLGSEAVLRAYEDDLRERWEKVVSSAGLRTINEHGLDVRWGYSDVERYVSKFGVEEAEELLAGEGEGWTLEREIAKASSKRGKPGHRNPFGLLEDYVNGDEEAGRRFVEYAGVFKGKRQLYWSNGLRAVLQLEPEKDDEQLAAAVEDNMILLASLNLRAWKVVLGNDARGEVLEVASRGDRVQLVGFLVGLGALEEDIV